MSALAETARVSVVLADFGQADAVNKVHILGAGWQITGLDPQTGNTAPQTLIVFVDISPDHHNETYALEAALYDESGELVQVPGPTGQLMPLRIGQSVTAEPPLFPGRGIPSKSVWSHAQMVLNFPGGVALASGRAYTWRVRIDGDVDSDWAISFFVAGAPPSPVIG